MMALYGMCLDPLESILLIYKTLLQVNFENLHCGNDSS